MARIHQRVATYGTILFLIYCSHLLALTLTQWLSGGVNVADGASTAAEILQSLEPEFRFAQAQLAPKRPAVAFVTYELYPVTTYGGGAGVVINGLVTELLMKGHDVVVVADMALTLLNDWDAHITKRLAGVENCGKLHIRHVQSVLDRHGVTKTQQGETDTSYKASKSIFLEKSRSFAKVLQLVYSDGTQFDIVECFDYAGVCYELLQRGEYYVSAEVTVNIRMHGSLELIDTAERAHVPYQPYTERNVMYLMERYALQSADLVTVQTDFFVNKMSGFYQFDSREIQVGRAPIESILAYVDEADATVLRLQAPDTWKQQHQVLIYGRLQLAKGLECIVAAALKLLANKDQQTKFTLLFVGPDQYSDDHKMMTSKYLQGMVPAQHVGNFKFDARPINRTELVTLSRQSWAAIFASEFETLNLAVHEMARLRVPLILSSIPAFREYFADSNQAWFFDVGDADSLVATIRQVAKDGVRVQSIRDGATKMHYDDATKVYRNQYTYPNGRRRDREASQQLRRLIDDGAQVLDYVKSAKHR